MFPKRGWHDSLFPGIEAPVRRWKCRISFGFRMRNGLGLGRFCRRIRAAWRAFDDRRVLSGIVHALRNGGRWADCPREVYGPKKTLYNRFVRWAGARHLGTLGGARHLGTGAYSARWRAAKTPPTGCSSIQPASSSSLRTVGGKGFGLGPWQSAAPRGAATPSWIWRRCLRCERQAPHPAR